MVIHHTVHLGSGGRPIHTSFGFADDTDLRVVTRDGRILLREHLQARGIDPDHDVAAVVEEIEKKFRR
jgi:hypothetical protein